MSTFRGRVEKRRVNAGSRSEHDAVVLATDEGDLVLRRQGGDPWFDPELEALVGHDLQAEGQIHRGDLFLTSWQHATLEA